MIIFALYLHVCSTQPVMKGGHPGETVTSCEVQSDPRIFASQALCDAAGKGAITTPVGASLIDTVRQVDRYECRSVTVNSK